MHFQPFGKISSRRWDRVAPQKNAAVATGFHVTPLDVQKKVFVLLGASHDADGQPATDEETVLHAPRLFRRIDVHPAGEVFAVEEGFEGGWVFREDAGACDENRRRRHPPSGNAIFGVEHTILARGWPSMLFDRKELEADGCADFEGGAGRGERPGGLIDFELNDAVGPLVPGKCPLTGGIDSESARRFSLGGSVAHKSEAACLRIHAVGDDAVVSTVRSVKELARGVHDEFRRRLSFSFVAHWKGGDGLNLRQHAALLIKLECGDAHRAFVDVVTKIAIGAERQMTGMRVGHCRCERRVICHERSFRGVETVNVNAVNPSVATERETISWGKVNAVSVWFLFLSQNRMLIHPRRRGQRSICRDCE